MITIECVSRRRETRCKTLSGWFCRRSFTLVELLVAISIMAILGTMTMIALAGAQRDAEVSRTRSTIRKINEIILAKWEEYATRQLPVELPVLALVPNPNAGGAIPVAGQEIARMRMVGLRDLMRMEMPDRITDVLWSPTLLNIEVRLNNNRSLYPLGSLPYPSLWSGYRERFVGFAAPATFSPPSNLGPATALWSPANASAELLYFVVASSSSSGIGGLETFRPTELGDTDGDGFPEFIDAWGRPIFWIRWPAGASWSEIVASAAADSQLLENKGGDAMDVTKSDWRYLDDIAGTQASRDNNPFTLQPLILSAGPDGAFDIVFDTTNIDNSAAPVTYATQRPTFTIPGPYVHGSSNTYYYPDPYRAYDVGGTLFKLGMIYDYDPNGSHVDNVTSHDTLFDQ